MAEIVSTSIASANELSLAYGVHTVLDKATVAIHEGDRIGLLGRNGCGKSSFMKIVAGEEEPDSGIITYKRDLVIGYLPQKFDLEESQTVMENVLSGASHITAMINKYESLPGDSDESADLLDQITVLDGWNLESRCQSLINNLHAPPADRSVDTLSGGERRRVGLCRALLAQPEFLILDEPTNHLDTEAIEWLETFLARYSGTCLFVTHDRYFLDRVATRIVEISRGVFQSYEGSYNDYLITRAERAATEEREEHKRQNFLKREIQWVRRQPKARGTKSRDRLDRFAEVQAQEAPEQELDVDLIIPPASQSSNRIIDAENLSITLGGKTLFTNFNIKIEGGERIGLVGRNGLGKSTLLRVLLKMMEPDTGTVLHGARTNINYVDQNRLNLDDQKSVFDEVGQGIQHVKLGDDSIGLRAYLRRFLFTDERINTKIELLSGGERSRVLLAKILCKGGNVLVLDEPTNDLDLATLRVLEEALLTFKGTLLVVSHDRYFLNRVCTSILGFEGDGRIFQQPGNYDYYLEKRDQRLLKPSATKQKGKATVSKKEKPRKLKWAEERELETIEETILKAETAVASLEEKFTAPDFYEKHADNWKELQKELDQSKENVTNLYARWEKLEAIKAAQSG